MRNLAGVTVVKNNHQMNTKNREDYTKHLSKR